MITWIGNYFNTELEIAIKNFDSWEEWQKSQLKIHYIESNLSSYIYQKPGYKNPYIKYCFGDFENIYYMPENINEITYFTLLLTTYDRCKGYLRSFKGDLTGINLLRKVVKDKNSDELYNHDFKIYDYNYTIIHAHTVSYFSLSTLIMYLVSNYMHFKSYNSDHFPHIDLELCKIAYNTKIYGDIIYVNSNKELPKSNIISIKAKETNVRPCNSWHGKQVSTINKCTNCNRVCDSYWSKHKLCLNCHLYEVCSICAGQKFSVGADNYPKCCIHQNM
jgi:hypothetical protein